MIPFFRNRRRRRPRGLQYLACMMCGSADLEKVRHFDGPVTYDHDTAEAHRCHACGHTGIPCSFESENEREEFRNGIEKKASKGCQ